MVSNEISKKTSTREFFKDAKVALVLRTQVVWAF